MAQGRYKVLAPVGGVALTAPGQTIPANAWTIAHHVRFAEGRVERWPGYTGFGIKQLPSAESVLKLYDFVVNVTTRFLVAITSKHIWVYSASEGQWTTIDVDNGVLAYATGTVTVSTTGVVGAGGADWIAGGIAVDDIITVTNLAVDDDRYRVVTAVTSATQLSTEPGWSAADTGRAYVIRRPRYTYTLTERPWCVSYLGELFVGSLSAAEIVYWAGTAMQMSRLSSHAGYALPNGATKLQARDAFLFSDHLVLVHTDVGGAATEPRTLRWSEIGQPANFNDTAVGTEAGAMGIEDTQEFLVAGAKLGELGIIYATDSLHALSYIGYPFVYVRRQLTANFGLLCKEGLAVLTDRHLFVGSDDFYSLTEGGIESIGEPVRRAFFADLDRAFTHLITSTLNDANSEWIIAYKSVGGTTSFPDKLLIYNYRLNVWSTGAAPSWTALAHAKVNNVTSARIINQITSNVEDYVQVYDSALAGSLASYVVAGSGAAAAGSKIVSLQGTSTLEATLERTGIRLTDDTEQMQVLTWASLGFSGAGSSGIVRVTFGAAESEDEDYTWDTPTDYVIGSGDVIPLALRGRLFAIRIQTLSLLGDATFALERYQLRGEVLNER